MVFDDARASAQLRTLIESAISEEFGFDARIVPPERAPLVSLAESIPPTWKDDSTMRCYFTRPLGRGRPALRRTR